MMLKIFYLTGGLSFYVLCGSFGEVTCPQTESLSELLLRVKLNPTSMGCSFVFLHRALLCNYIDQHNAPFLKEYFNFCVVLYMFRNLEFIFRKTVVRIGMLQHVLHASVQAVLQVEETACTDADRTLLQHTCAYSRLPEDEPSVSKHVKDAIKIKIVIYKRYIFWLILCNYTMFIIKFII